MGGAWRRGWQPELHAGIPSAPRRPRPSPFRWPRGVAMGTRVHRPGGCAGCRPLAGESAGAWPRGLAPERAWRLASPPGSRRRTECGHLPPASQVSAAGRRRQRAETGRACPVRSRAGVAGSDRAPPQALSDPDSCPQEHPQRRCPRASPSYLSAVSHPALRGGPHGSFKDPLWHQLSDVLWGTAGIRRDHPKFSGFPNNNTQW